MRSLFHALQVFSPVLIGGHSLNSVSHQVSSSLQDFSRYSSQFYQSYVLDFSSDFKFFKPFFFTKPLRSVPIVPTTIGITVILMFHSFF